MDLVTAIIKPFKPDDVRDALSEVGVSGIAVTEVKGFGRQKDHTEPYRGAEYVVDFLPKAKIELAIDAAMLDPVLESTVRSGAGAGADFSLISIDSDDDAEDLFGDRITEGRALLEMSKSF